MLSKKWLPTILFRMPQYLNLYLVANIKRYSIIKKSIAIALMSWYFFKQDQQTNPSRRCSTLRFVCAAQRTTGPLRSSRSLRKCSAEYSPALASLNPTTTATSIPHNSALLSLHSLHFVTLSFRSVGNAVLRIETTKALLSASLRLRNPPHHRAA